MTALNWLFPERVGKKHKARHAVPIGGEYVCDVDSYLIQKRHGHIRNNYHICQGCIEISKYIAIQLIEKIEAYYSDIAIVFSGRRGFHIHVKDFDLVDWTYYDPRNPIKSHEVARLKITRLLKLQAYGFDRAHFLLSVDPMRVLAVPGSLNADCGLICTYIGDRQDLEKASVRDVVERSKPTSLIYCHAEPARAMRFAAR
jgi:DNA primase catalytic subunit